MYNADCVTNLRTFIIHDGISRIYHFYRHIMCNIYSKFVLATVAVYFCTNVPVVALSTQVEEPIIVSTHNQPVAIQPPPEKPDSALIVPALINKPVQRLADIKKIFVAPLGTDDGAELIRQKIINRLIKSENFSIVESADDADATLTGAAGISTSVSFNRYGRGGTHFSAYIVVRLIGKTKQVLWMEETRPRLFGALSASSNVAGRVITDLTKAITVDKAERLASTQ